MKTQNRIKKMCINLIDFCYSDICFMEEEMIETIIEKYKEYTETLLTYGYNYNGYKNTFSTCIENMKKI